MGVSNEISFVYPTSHGLFQLGGSDNSWVVSAIGGLEKPLVGLVKWI